MLNILQLVVLVALILYAARLMCNALEHIGMRLNITAGVTGSLLIAVATAMPETLVAIIALFHPHSANASNYIENISGGTIIGPPLMLSTISLMLLALAVWYKRGINGVFKPAVAGIVRDLNCFSFSFIVAICLALSHAYYRNNYLDNATAVLLLCTYIYYVWQTIRHGKNNSADKITITTQLILCKCKLPANLITMCMQVIIGITILMFSTHLFIALIAHLSTQYGVSLFVISAVLIPLATELPEKVNSILWVRQQKDTLAFANITGAMVFQAAILPVLGILLTPWTLSTSESISCLSTLCAVYWLLTIVNNCKIYYLLISGMIYLLNLWLIYS